MQHVTPDFGLLLPQQTFPICILGAGGIVKNAHLPAYAEAGFAVHGLCDPQPGKAKALATQHGIAHAHESIAAAVAAAPKDCVYDIAVPASAALEVLSQLPEGSFALLQKPMGENLAAAEAIFALCEQRGIRGGINFQLRHAPNVRGARSLIDGGHLGELLDIEVKVSCNTPWGLWDFLKDLPRMEMLYHSIHYLDLVRSFFGEPRRVFAHCTGHPSANRITSTRSCIVLDYGKYRRAVIHTNHDHKFGERCEESYVKWEGTKGAIRAQMGVNLDYPRGRPDDFAFCLLREGEAPAWQEAKVPGNWFPQAFIGPMSELMRQKGGEIAAMSSSFADGLQTMRVLEDAYRCHEG